MLHKYSTAILTGALGLTMAFGIPSRAEEKDGAKITGQTVSATGCLTKDTKEKNEYVITDAEGRALDDSGTPKRELANPGAVLEFTAR